jgi:hypothetical protein
MFMILELALSALVACDPALAALFTPRHPQMGNYEVCTTEQPIEQVAPAGALVEATEPLDAFGAAGTYDRWKLARLYDGKRARVAHQWTHEGDSFESVTFISPYPDVTLTHLFPGTMLIRWTKDQ